MNRLCRLLCLLLLLGLLAPAAAMAFAADGCADCDAPAGIAMADDHACDGDGACTTHGGGCVAHCVAAVFARAPALPAPTSAGETLPRTVAQAPEAPPDLPLRPPIVA